MAKKLLSRKEVPVEETWDLSLIYKTDKEFKADVEEIKKLAKEIVRVYKGQLQTSRAVNDCLDVLRTLEEKMGLAEHYVSLAASVITMILRCRIRRGRLAVSFHRSAAI